MRRKLLPKRTLVEIIKPEDPLAWHLNMNQFIGTRVFVHRDEGDFLILTEDCTCEYNRVYGYNWHPNWIKVISKDKDGNPEPYDNQDSIICYWCSGALNMIIEHFERLVEFHYCPRCKR